MVTFTYDNLHRPTQKSGINTDLVSGSYSAPSARKITATSPMATDTTYFNERGQPGSIETVLAGQTFVRRYGYRKTAQLAKDGISGGGIANGGRGGSMGAPKRPPSRRTRTSMFGRRRCRGGFFFGGNQRASGTV